MDSTHLLRITLLDLEPPVWRHVLVPGSVTLAKLHEILQVVMEWDGSHLWDFQVGEQRFGPPDMEMPEVRDARKVRLGGLKLGKGSSFSYTYDYGDNWEHEIVVEALEDPRPEVRYPFCIGGRRACPPEHCGGPGGYEEMLEALSDPEHEGHEDALDWLGEDFDPEHFSAEEINAELEDFGLRKRGPRPIAVPQALIPQETEEMRALAERLRDPTTILTDAEVALATAYMSELMPMEFILKTGRPIQTMYEETIRLHSLHTRFKQERERRGLSIREVARSLKVPQYRLKAIEGLGTSSMAPQFVRAYARFLGLEAWLSQWAEANPNLAGRVLGEEPAGENAGGKESGKGAPKRRGT